MQITEEALDNILNFEASSVDKCMAYAKVDFHWRNTISFIGEQAAKEAFNKGSSYTKEARGVGKTLGLALCYGGNDYTVKRAYPNKTDAECKQMVNNFYQANKTLSKYLKKNIENMRETSYVKTILGRKIPVFGWNVTKDFYLRSKAENAASNYPVQGSGGEVIRIMNIDINKWVEENNMFKLMFNNATRKYVNRIAYIDVSTKSIEDIDSELDKQEDGNTLVVVTDGNEVVGEYHRTIAFSPNKLPDYKIFF